jgi:hypothetical protein
VPPATVLTDNVGFITPGGAGFALVMCGLLLCLPRRHALIPVIVLTCFMTMGQRLIIGGLDFTMLRVLLLVGWARVILRREIQLGKLNAIDKAIIAFAVSSIVTYTLLWGTVGAFVNRLGFAYSALGAYFLFRMLLRDTDDCLRVVKVTAVLVIPLAAIFVYESVTGENVFAVFGGVPPATTIRDGRLRCQGPFGHPILAGTFGATLVPLFIGLWRQPGRIKPLALAALASCGVIVYASASSGPVVALLGGLFGVALWPLRKYMGAIRWAVVAGLVALALVMKAPVWFLIARISIVSGSTAYFRAYLIDRAIANFWDWWLIGTRSTRAWADASLGLHDRTNQYIAIGADGGLVSLVMFVAMIALSFRAVGNAVRGASPASSSLRFCVWTFGAALFAHAVNYSSVSYFDQNFINWYLLLALISTASLSMSTVRGRAPAQVSYNRSVVRGASPSQRARSRFVVRAPMGLSAPREAPRGPTAVKRNAR